MQTQGAAQRGGGVGTTPRRGGRWFGVAHCRSHPGDRGVDGTDDAGDGRPCGYGRVGAQHAKAGAVGSAIVHDDAGIMHASMVNDVGQMRGTEPGIMHASMVKDMGHDDAGNMPATGAGAAVIHDDAGNVR